jgi:REP element-mobilizing transposase RayT
MQESSSSCSRAYQLNWSLSVFGKERLPNPESTFHALREAVLRDELHLLEFYFREPNVVQFLISSQPQSSLSSIIRSIKGRWQYLSRDIEPIEFRRNYRITSVGDANNAVLSEYVAKQPNRHRMADPQVDELLHSLQFSDPTIHLDKVQRSSYGEYVHNLHIVLETSEGWNEVRENVLRAYLQAIQQACREERWRLSRIGLVCNHIHILLGAGIADAPERVALELLRRVKEAQSMKGMWKSSYYVGSFGAYDRGAIWNALKG